MGRQQAACNSATDNSQEEPLTHFHQLTEQPQQRDRQHAGTDHRTIASHPPNRSLTSGHCPAGPHLTGLAAPYRSTHT